MGPKNVEDRERRDTDGTQKDKSGRKQFRESNYDQWKKTLEAVRKRLDDNPSPGENPAMTFPWKEDGCV